MRGWRGLAVLLVLLLSASTSFAAGFRLPEAGVKAMGMGFAFTAQADDPSAIYFNPAGLTQLDRNNVMLGVTYVKENGGTFTGTTPLSPGFPNPATAGTVPISETQKDLNFFLPNMYYTYTSKAQDVAFGVGVFSPFGLGQEYQNANTSYFRNQITKIDLQTVVVNPTIAFKFGEAVSVGFGVDFMYGKANLRKTPVNIGIGDNSAVPSTYNMYSLELDADATAWGYNFGLLITPVKNLRLGFNIRSPFTLKFKDGDVDVSGISTAGRTALGGGSISSTFFGGATTYHTAGSTTLKLPATAAAGVAYTWDKLTVEVDGDWTFWSSYQSLVININSQPPQNQVIPNSTTQAKNWRDVCAIRTGLEYRITNPLAIRAGFVYDPTPVPAETLSPELPDATRLNYMLGLGYKYGNWTIDIAGMYIDKKDRNVANQDSPPIVPSGPAAGTARNGANGTWTGDAWLAGLDISYKF